MLEFAANHFEDASRNNRKVSLTIWYPAIQNSESDPVPSSDASPDMSAAPYPVIMSSSKVGFIFADNLYPTVLFTSALIGLIPIEHSLRKPLINP